MTPTRHEVHRAARNTLRELDARSRYEIGRLSGVVYRLRGRHPDPDVSDDVLADRVRSRLGPLRRRLDVPRIHVMVEHGVALVHGDVATPIDADVIEAAVASVAGIAGVESHLHVGLLPSDTRPAEGQAHFVSGARRRLVAAAANATGFNDRRASAVVQAVLSTLVERLPTGEREHFLSHLPAYVRQLSRRRIGRLEAINRIRTRTDFVLVVAGTTRLPYQRAAHATEAVLGVARELVPDEAADVAAVLPEDLRELWTRAVPG